MDCIFRNRMVKDVGNKNAFFSHIQNHTILIISALWCCYLYLMYNRCASSPILSIMSKFEGTTAAGNCYHSL